MTTTAKFRPITLDTPEYAIKMTAQTFKEIFGGEPRDIRVRVKTPVPVTPLWPTWRTLQLPTIRRHWEDKGYGTGSRRDRVIAVTFYGERSLYRLKEEGYLLGGKCKVEGKEVSGYTSDIMVEVEDRLFVIAVISIRGEE
jgi:hypothetical protein